MDVTLPDGAVVRGVPDGTTKEQLLHKLLQSKHPSAQALLTDMSGKMATEGQSFLQNAAAGAGKAVSDIGLGARQLIGNASQKEVDEVKARDAALMNTGGGLTGNIAGNIGLAVMPGLGAAGIGRVAGMPALQAAGKAMLGAPASVGGAATQAGLGAIQAGLQPVESGGSRLTNTAIGAGAGAAVPIAGMAMKFPGAAIEPTYQSGREAILGRTLRRVTGDDQNVAGRLSGAKELVPGSFPTAAQAGGNAGLASLERAAFASEPTVTNEISERLAAQNAARVNALRDMAGSGGKRDVLASIRDTGADEMYGAARALGVNQEMANALKPQINNLMQRMPSGVMEKAKELARVNGETLGKEGSVNGLHWMKLAVDDLLSSGKQTGIGSQTTRALTQFKNDLVSVVDELSPAYGQARQSFAEMSKPINQMDVAGAIGGKAIRPLDESMTAAAYARAMNDQTVKSATGFSGATLANTMEPKQLSTLNAIKEDLARSEFAKNAGRGAGSDTVQKLAFNNLMQQSGINGMPSFLSRPLMIAEYLGRSVYGSADKEMRRVLAEALLDPKKTAELLGKGIPSEKAAMLAQAIRSTATPAAIGGASSALNSR